MRKYLEKVKELSDATKLMACLKPYVCATEDGQIEYTPFTNGLEILTHESEKERILDAGTWEFYIPFVYFIRYADEWYDANTPTFTIRPLSGSSDGMATQFTGDVSPYELFGSSIYTNTFMGSTVDGNDIREYNITSNSFWIAQLPLTFLVKASININ